VTAAGGFLALAMLVLVHTAVVEMAENRWRLPRLGMSLLCLLLLTTIVASSLGKPGAVPWMVRLLEIVQAVQTASVLYGGASRETRIPARFTALALVLFAIFVVLRSGLTAAGLLNSAQLSSDALLATLIVHLSAILAIGFGLFWMATTILTSGLEQMASTDPLTRIYNRRVFLMWCERELERSRRTEGPFSILMVDLDRFKHINDRYGHHTGDEALCAAVEKMQDSVRGIDVLGRWGGEEFAVLLPHASAEAALLVAERVRASIARILLPARETRKEDSLEAVRVTASIGVATFLGSSDSVQSMVERADGCLYQAKAQGRNRVVTIFQKPPDTRPPGGAPGSYPTDLALPELKRERIYSSPAAR
jgi:diguanylate cyclase (GGDEF)-like protein